MATNVKLSRKQFKQLKKQQESS
jgi:hypothetical protein